MTKPNTKSRANAVDIYVGEQLRLIRRANNVTQEELAHAVGLTFQQIQKYEKGYNRIAAGRLYYVAEFFNVPVTDFYPHPTGVNAPSVGQLLNDNKDLKRRLKKIRSVIND